MRELRARYDMTQEEFAAHIGVQPHSVYNYESLGARTRNPSFECLKKIALKCGCESVCFLLLGKGSKRDRQSTLLDDPKIRAALRELLDDAGAK